MKNQFYSGLLVIACTLAFTGCAHIPHESAALSQNIGTGITQNHQSQVALINSYFDQKREAVDRFIENEYTPAYVADVQKKLGTNSLDADMMRDILQRIAKKRDAMQSDLDKTRQTILDRVNSDYTLLIQANHQLTALLQSAGKVQAADAALTGALKNASNSQIDFQQLDQKFNDYLQKAGDISQKTSSLYNELQSTFAK